MNKCTSTLQASKHDNIPATPVKQDYAKLNETWSQKWKDKGQTEKQTNNKSKVIFRSLDHHIL